MTDQTIPDEFANERARQIEEEGYDPATDVGRSVQLLQAAASYVFAAAWAERYGSGFALTPPAMWPFKDHYWKGGSAQRMREKAGALTLAALEAQVTEFKESKS